MSAGDMEPSGAVAMLHMRPCSESREDIAEWISYLRKEGAKIAASLIENTGRDKWDEWGHINITSGRYGLSGSPRL